MIEKAKEYIDAGWDQLGRKARRGPVEVFLIASSIRAIRLADALVLLCKSGYSDESLIILRSLIETAVNMRWVINKDAEDRVKEYFSAFDEGRWLGDPWTDLNIFDRMREIGFDEDYYRFVVKLCHDVVHGNAGTFPWGAFLPEINRKDPVGPSAAYAVAAQMLGHVLRALDAHWHGKFDGYEEIWSQIKAMEPETKERIEKSFGRLKKSNPRKMKGELVK